MNYIRYYVKNKYMNCIKKLVSDNYIFDVVLLSLQRYSAYHFGEQAIDSVHLSQRYSTGDDGYYMCTANIALS